MTDIPFEKLARAYVRDTLFEDVSYDDAIELLYTTNESFMDSLSPDEERETLDRLARAIYAVQGELISFLNAIESTQDVIRGFTDALNTDEENH